MTTLLSDHDCEGQAKRILYSLQKLGYAQWLDIEIVLFDTYGLPYDAKDSEIWEFCQETGLYLLTGNRTVKDGEDSLQSVINNKATKDSYPVITIGNPSRVNKDKLYCNACAETLAEIVFNAELYVGIPRLYIP